VQFNALVALMAANLTMVQQGLDVLNQHELYLMGLLRETFRLQRLLNGQTQSWGGHVRHGNRIGQGGGFARSGNVPAAENWPCAAAAAGGGNPGNRVNRENPSALQGVEPEEAPQQPPPQIITRT